MTAAQAQIAAVQEVPALNREFCKLWDLFGNGQRLEAEWRPFPERDYRLDFAHVATKVAIECDGGVHTIRKVWERDLTRQNLLVLHGWRLVRLTSKALHDDPRGAVAMVAAMIDGGKR